MKNKPHAEARKIRTIKMDVSLEEAYQHIKQRKTFFHIFFTMRDSVGGDMELFSKLNLKPQGKNWSGWRAHGAIFSHKLGIKFDKYFDLVRQPRFPEPEELQQIIKGVEANKELKEALYPTCSTRQALSLRLRKVHYTTA